ncbi:MAG: POTRA domain-containing protein, partial [Alphaproteobacteria bacterium]
MITLAGTAGATSRQSGQIEDRLPGREGPRTAPASSVPETSGEPDAVKAQAIFLNALDLKGSTVLAKDDVDSLAAEFIGKSLSTEDLARLAGRLTQAYRDRGFFLSRVIIPPQEIKAGRLTAQAIEGYVVSARGEGVADDDAASQFASLLNERPASLATFERALLLMSDRYGYKVSGTRLLPVEGTSDQFQLEFAVTWRPVSLEFFADNRGTGRNGEDQAFTGVSWKSILSAGDQLSASIFSSFA